MFRVDSSTSTSFARDKSIHIHHKKMYHPQDPCRVSEWYKSIPKEDTFKIVFLKLSKDEINCIKRFGQYFQIYKTHLISSNPNDAIKDKTLKSKVLQSIKLYHNIINPQAQTTYALQQQQYSERFEWQAIDSPSLKNILPILSNLSNKIQLIMFQNRNQQKICFNIRSDYGQFWDSIYDSFYCYEIFNGYLIQMKRKFEREKQSKQLKLLKNLLSKKSRRNRVAKEAMLNKINNNNNIITNTNISNFGINNCDLMEAYTKAYHCCKLSKYTTNARNVLDMILRSKSLIKTIEMEKLNCSNENKKENEKESKEDESDTHLCFQLIPKNILFSMYDSSESDIYEKSLLFRCFVMNENMTGISHFCLGICDNSFVKCFNSIRLSIVMVWNQLIKDSIGVNDQKEKENEKEKDDNGAEAEIKLFKHLIQRLLYSKFKQVFIDNKSGNVFLKQFDNNEGFIVDFLIYYIKDKIIVKIWNIERFPIMCHEYGLFDCNNEKDKNILFGNYVNSNGQRLINQNCPIRVEIRNDFMLNDGDETLNELMENVLETGVLTKHGLNLLECHDIRWKASQLEQLLEKQKRMNSYVTLVKEVFSRFMRFKWMKQLLLLFDKWVVFCRFEKLNTQRHKLLFLAGFVISWVMWCIWSQFLRWQTIVVVAVAQSVEYIALTTLFMMFFLTIGSFVAFVFNMLLHNVL